MWQVDKVYAENLFSFKTLRYKLDQGKTTLIYGNNEDSDNQGSNGSGKSSLNEAIAIATIGSPLRKCNTSEIINDDADTCLVRVGYINHALKQEMIVTRQFYRKESSLCSVDIFEDVTKKEVKLSGVAETGKFILDTLGITKDDFLNYMVLSKYTYKNFLSATDKEKKEIINNFSNGNKVDEAIDLLLVDIKDSDEELNEATLKQAELSGKVDVLKEQIQNENLNAKERQKLNQTKIEETEDEIKELRKNIREAKQRHSEEVTRLDNVKGEASNWEDTESKIKASDDVDWIIDTLTSKLSEFGISSDSLNDSIDKIYSDIETYESQTSAIKISIESGKKDIEKLNQDLYHASEEAEKEDESFDKQRKQKDVEISKIKSDISSLKKSKSTLSDEIEAIRGKCRALQTIIKGKIKCPKCQHEFVLDSDISLEEANIQLQEKTNSGIEKKSKLDDLSLKEKESSDKLSDAQDKQLKIPFRSELHGNVEYIKSKINKLSNEVKRNAENLKNIEEFINSADKKIIKIINEHIDIVGDAIDKKIYVAATNENRAKKAYESLQSDLSVSEARLDQLRSFSCDSAIESLQQSLNSYKGQLSVINTDVEAAIAKVDNLKIQEQVFIQYKTHLANTKIEALSQVTNALLEDIGSELRVQFVGFKVLKSGKVRDKITVNLLRNGEEVGSYGKLSVGEQGRINLACILAMNKLVNANCESNKGMNLLVLDEILDGIDASGLDSILEALNNTGNTCLVVSHGKTSESYPYYITINKKHGESSIM